MFVKSLFWIVINIVLSILTIYSGHYIWKCIKDTYSTKKTKDLVNTQIHKYKKMMAEIQNDSYTSLSRNHPQMSTVLRTSDFESNSTFLNDTEKIDMDHRLMEFMDDIQLKN